MERLKLSSSEAAVTAILALPACLCAALSCVSGGFSPEWTALAALLVLVILAIRLTTAGVDDINLVVAVCFGALGLLAVWILVPGHWSHAPARAALEYGRMLLYVAVFVLFGSLGRSDGRARVLLGALGRAQGSGGLRPVRSL